MDEKGSQDKSQGVKGGLSRSGHFFAVCMAVEKCKEANPSHGDEEWKLFIAGDQDAQKQDR